MRMGLLVLLVVACNKPASVEIASEADQDMTARLDALEARLDAAEATIATTATNLQTCQDDLAALTSTVDLQGQAFDAFSTEILEAIAELDDEMGDLADTQDDQAALVSALESAMIDAQADINDLQDAVDTMDGGSTSATSGISIYSSSAATATGGSSSSWASVVADIDLALTEGQTVLGICTSVDSGTYEQYRLSITGTAVTGTSEAVGDASGGTLAYAAESLTVLGTFEATSDGDATIACQARYAGGHDITFIVLVF